MRSQLPTVTVLDLSYYLMAPAAVLASSAIFTGSTLLFAVSMVLNPGYYASAQGVAFAGFIYLLSFGPSLYLAALYRKRSGDISRRSAFVMAHLLALYNYIWYVAEWKAVARIVLRKNGWAKTRRAVEVDPAPAVVRTLLSIATGSDGSTREQGVTPRRKGVTPSNADRNVDIGAGSPMAGWAPDRG